MTSTTLALLKAANTAHIKWRTLSPSFDQISSGVRGSPHLARAVQLLDQSTQRRTAVYKSNWLLATLTISLCGEPHSQGASVSRHDVTGVARHIDRIPAGVQAVQDDLSTVDQIAKVVQGAPPCNARSGKLPMRCAAQSRAGILNNTFRHPVLSLHQ